MGDKLHRRAIRRIMTTSDIKWKIKVASEGKIKRGKVTGATKKRLKQQARRNAEFIAALDALDENQ